jgi:mono/diheme cytochrome c family protein
MRHLPICSRVAGSVLILMLGSAVVTAAAAEQQSGRELYLRYCGACHGPQAKGDGVASSLMRPSPPDLTLLAKQHGGDFPLDSVVKTIDGREMPRAHGDPWMPVWGTVLGEDAARQGKSPAATEEHVKGRIHAIAEYLRTIQAH